MARILKCRTPGAIFNIIINGVSSAIVFDQGSGHDEALVADDAVSYLLNYTSGDYKVYDPNPEPEKRATNLPVDNLSALKMIDNYIDKQLCLAEDMGLFRFDAESTDTPDDVKCVKPDDITEPDPGRWIKISGNTESLPWGSLTGSLADQTDIVSVLETKVLKVGDDNIEITDNTKGFILCSPNGTRYRIRVKNNGELATVDLT